MTSKISMVFFVAIVAVVVFAAQPVFAVPYGDRPAASDPAADVSDQQCLQYKGKCEYKKLCNPSMGITPENIGIMGKPCVDPRGVTGACVEYGVCRAQKAAESSGGGSMNVGDLSGLFGALSQILGALGGGGGGGGSGSGSDSTGSYSSEYQNCPQYYETSVPSSDPCAYYVPGSDTTTGGTGTNSDDILFPDDFSDPTSGSGSGSQINSNDGSSSDQAGTSNGTNSNGNNGGTSSSASSSTANSSASSSASLGGSSAPNGEIRVLPNGATIVVSNQNGEGNSVVAGFLGNDAKGGAQPQGLVAGWCRTRPWASNFLSYIIPPVFFDSFCSLRGYGASEEPVLTQTTVSQQATLTQQKVTPKNPTTTAPVKTVPASPPMTVDIWAVPASVPLGARTTVFWTSKNAVSCTETSPDGSFSHNSLSGGGATVPLAGATTYTISCTAPDGTYATDYVTVNLSI